jgi:Chaperonin 10 Kd subunit
LAIRKAPSGIIIPDTAQEKPQQGKVTAAKLPDQIASVFLLLALFGKQIDYLLSV